MSKSNKAREEIYINDFYKSINEKDNLSNYTSKNKWEYVPYETSVTSGNLLIASNESNPKPVTITPNLDGWYKIYVCMGDLNEMTYGAMNHIDIRLSFDEFPTSLGPCRMGDYSMWSRAENVEESFWKCADMTHQSIYISKPDLKVKYTSNIFWIHFIPMTDDEIKKYKEYKPSKNMLAHMDGDYHFNDVTKAPVDYCKPIYALKDSDVGILCEEITNDIFDYMHPSKDYVQRNEFNTRREKLFKTLSRNRKNIYPVQVKYAHKHNMKLFAAQRMQLSNFSFPLSGSIFHIDFVDKHRELRCVARDGSYIDFLSYGYKETQDFMIKSLIDAVKYGFDGILCIWTRGIHLGFEKPVIDRFIEKYGNDIDIYSLKEDDPRLVETKCDIMVDFHTRLKEKLLLYTNKNNLPSVKIFITGCYDVDSSLLFGIDIERLAKLKLIDGVIQTKYKQIEQVDDVIEDNKINIEKYKEKAQTSRITERVTGSRIDLLVEGTKKYREIADKYGINYYTEIQWEGLKKAEEYVDGAKQILSSYGMNISLWDCYPTITTITSEFSAVSHLGDRDKVLKMSEKPDDYHKIIKVLSYNNVSIKYIDPSWRG